MNRTKSRFGAVCERQLWSIEIFPDIANEVAQVLFVFVVKRLVDAIIPTLVPSKARNLVASGGIVVRKIGAQIVDGVLAITAEALEGLRAMRAEEGSTLVLVTHDPAVAELADRRRAGGLDFLISVDGGVNDQTGPACREAGADILVSGSWLLGADDRLRRTRLLRG